MNQRFLATLITTVLCISAFDASDVSASQDGLADACVYRLEGKGFIKEWGVLGTFPSPQVDTPQPDGSSHLGFYKDYLTSIGGEKGAAIASDAVIEYENENGETVSVISQKVVASDSGVVDLDELFGKPDNVMAYAFCYINSDKDQIASFSLGSDDGVKVWVNGQLVHSNYVGRGLSFGQDKFAAKLHKGNNPVLIKVIDMVNGWGYAMEVFDDEASVLEKEIQRKKQALIDSKIPTEKLLWPDGMENNPVSYQQQNIMQHGSWHPDAPLQISRAYSNVSTPTYFIYQAPPEINTGVAVVILPGGGYTDVWLDAEGHCIALHLQKYGITSLVVKYRTNTQNKNGERPWSWDDYMPAPIADATEGIRILRRRAEELKLDPNKIGVGGFSAGGHLTLAVCVMPDTKETYPDFAFLIYPWIEEYSVVQTDQAKDQTPHESRRGLKENAVEHAAQTHGLPPMFIVNGQEDSVTPADTCAQLYYTLCKNKVPAELHIYTKGTHGFTLGLGQGNSTVQWTSSFIAWLKDINMIEGN
jgi:acetyl esterase/lipase